jgi:hypothetical protein
MAEKIVARMEDPKAKAAPDLSYGTSSISVVVEEDANEIPQRLKVSVDVELPEATVAKVLNQDLLAATRICGEAKKYLADRESFFKDQIHLRMKTKGVKVEAGFLTPELTAQNKKDFEWKEFAIKTLVKLLMLQDKKLKPAKALALAKSEAEKAYDRAKPKTHNKDGSPVKDSVSVKGVKLDR